MVPVFIVGMPRSDDFAEQIIPYIQLFHLQVRCLCVIWELMASLSKINICALQNFREKYLEKLKTIAKGKLIITDKMPQNFRLLGLLLLLFQRLNSTCKKTAAVCWANYTQFFSSKNLGYCYALNDVIEYYKMYKNLMEFWKQSLHERIMISIMNC